MIEKKLDRAITDFIWNVVEIHSQLEDIHTSWAGLLGITEPQWLILMAITELDEGRGVAGIDIANKLRVHPAFVTNQTKSLEKSGFLSRRPGADDARFVLMSLTAKATTEIEKLSKRKLCPELDHVQRARREDLGDLERCARNDRQERPTGRAIAGDRRFVA